MALKLKPSAQPQRRRLTLLRAGKGHAPDLADQLWAAVYLPQLAVDVFTQTSEPAVCRIEQRGKAVVWVANTQAQAQGVTAGCTLSAARALLPDLQVYERNEVLEQQAAERLALQLYGFSAWVHIAEPNMLLLELKASLKLFAGLEPLLQALRATVQSDYPQCFIAVAPTPSSAMLLARAGDETPLLHGQHTPGRLAQLPLAVMTETRPDWYARLQKLGLQHYGELLRLPRAGLQKRFGVELGEYIEQLLGHKAECPAAWIPPSQYQQQQYLQDEISQTPELLPALLVMLQALCEWLQQRAARVQRFNVLLYGHKQRLLSFEVAFLRPSNRLEAMQKLLELRLEREVLAAPVISIELSAAQLIYPRALSVGQQSLWMDQHSHDDSWWDSLETIQARLGADAVTGLACNDEHRPEMAWKKVLPGEAVACTAALPQRPLWLFEQPRRLSLSEQRALCLQSRPERIASGWWDKDAVYRDYFVARVEAKQLWVFRDVAQEPAQWFCHGVFS